ncbi:MAG: nucleotide-binding enzyme [Myxococcota bacterium]
MGLNHHDRRARVRMAIAREAARAMYREGVDQYFDAKRIAAKRVLGVNARGVRYRPQDLPSNGEIREALLELVSFAEGTDRVRRLFAMRVLALQTMRALAAYHPRLIGSVWTGHARRGSDIDLHVFTESRDRLELDLWERGWTFEPEEVLIREGTGFRAFHHIHVLDHEHPIELSVYEPHERRIQTRSSTTGKPIQRASTDRLLELIRREHAEAWATWLETGDVGFEEPELPPGDFDGLLEELGVS